MIEKTSLNSYWKFKIDMEDMGRKDGWYESIPAEAEDIWVPSCWNELREELYHYEGTAWYFKKFMFRRSEGIKRNVLFFSGVNYKCEIWLNGHPAGSHVGGFTPFEIDVSDLLLQDRENLLVLRVDSTIGDMTSPPIGVDWFNYGGIFREVYLNGTGDSWLDDVTVLTGMDGEIKFNIDIGNFDVKGIWELDLEIFDRDELLAVHTSSRKLSASGNSFVTSISKPKLWSPDSPFMYEFKLVLKCCGAMVDKWEHKIGIREFSIKDRKILLNGKPILLRGYSKHEEYPMHGRTFCKDIVRKDYEICKQGNANFARLCHYPHDLGEYEIASEMGFLVIAEVPNVNFGKEQFKNPELMELAVNQLKETIKYYKNETSIMFWSLFIECKTYEDAAVDFVPRYINLARGLDASRFTIHASDIPEQDRTYEYFDVIGVNYWFGWYAGDDIEGGSALLDRIAARYPDKPMVMTSGGWEGIYGYHSYKSQNYWSEEKQADYLEKLTEMYIKKDYIVGEIIWTFNDFRVSPWVIDNKARWPARPMEMNHKGVLDYYRRPKLSYYRMQEIFKKWDDKYSQ